MSPRIALVEREMARGPALVWRRAAIGLRMQAGLESPGLPRSPRRAGSFSPSPSSCSDDEAKIPMLGFEDDFMPPPIRQAHASGTMQREVAVSKVDGGPTSSEGGLAFQEDHDEDPFTVKKMERMTDVQFDSKLQTDINGWCGASEGELVWRFYDDLGRTTTFKLPQTPVHDGISRRS